MSNNSKKGNALINIVLFVVVVILAFAVFSKTNEGAVEGMASGLVKPEDIDPMLMYNETLINFFDPEPGWFPKRENNTGMQPEIAGEAAMLVDINSGDILYKKEAYKKMPIASLVKIMTAVVALEHKGIDERIYVTREAANIGENSMGIDRGEVYTLEELLYGLIMHSGNDAAYAIADGVAGNSDRFVAWMNLKAEELGLTDTHFADPSGLDDSTFSTAADMIKLTRYALKNPDFRKVAGTLEYEIYSDEDNKYLYLYNQTNLLSTYPGVAGVKTGYTEVAGLCLVTYAENEGKEVVGIVLNSIDRKGDMILMLDHGFDTLGVDIEHNLL